MNSFATASPESGAFRRAELARRLLAAFNDRDLAEACALTSPDVRFEVIAEQVTGTLPDGHEGLRAWLAAADRTWTSLRAQSAEFTLQEIEDWIVVDGETEGRARGTGRVLRWRWTAILRIEDDLVARFGVYLDRDAALKAIRNAR